MIGRIDLIDDRGCLYICDLYDRYLYITDESGQYNSYTITNGIVQWIPIFRVGLQCPLEIERRVNTWLKNRAFW